MTIWRKGSWGSYTLLEKGDTRGPEFLMESDPELMMQCHLSFSSNLSLYLLLTILENSREADDGIKPPDGAAESTIILKA